MCGIIASIGNDNSFFHCLCGLSNFKIVDMILLEFVL